MRIQHQKDSDGKGMMQNRKQWLVLTRGGQTMTKVVWLVES